MKRWHEEIHISKRNWRNHRNMHIESNLWRNKPNPLEIDCTCDNQIGRFRKRDAYDCGNARCQLCHSDKFPKRIITRQEYASKLKFEEYLKEELGE